MGIILFNRVFHFRIATSGAIVSVPIRGLFNLTLSLKQQIFTGSKMQKTAEITN